MLLSTTLILCVSYAAGNPAILINNDGSESDSKYLDCFNPVAEFDPSTGYITYRCRPVVKEVVEEIFIDKKPLFDLKKLNYINEIDSDPLKEIFEETFIADEPSDDDDDDEQMIYEVIDIEAKKPMSRINKNKNQGPFPLKNQNAKNDDECKLNCCPEGQMYQSELDICIDYTPGPARPSVASSEQNKNETAEKKPETIFISDSQEEQPQADAPQAKPQKSTQETVTVRPWKILSVGKFDIKNRCKDNEFYLSELDICVPLDK